MYMFCNEKESSLFKYKVEIVQICRSEVLEHRRKHPGERKMVKRIKSCMHI